jgi:hypothetical protein
LETFKDHEKKLWMSLSKKCQLKFPSIEAALANDNDVVVLRSHHQNVHTQHLPIYTLCIPLVSSLYIGLVHTAYCSESFGL